jgi:hypothetical protein
MGDKWLYLTAGITTAVFVLLAIVCYRTRKSNQNIAILSLAVSIIALVATIAQLAVAIQPVGHQVSDSATCDAVTSDGLAVVRPDTVGKLYFCPVLVNDGNLPITGPFNLRGQIIGPTSERDKLVLFVRLDRATCTTDGKPAPPGRFLIDSVRFSDSLDGGWSYRDNLGNYPPSLTFGRIFEFALAPKSAVSDLVQRREEWKQNGIEDLPSTVLVVASFKLAPGAATSKTPCTGG